MTGGPHNPDPDAALPTDAEEPATAGPDGAPAIGSDRRAFLRRLSGDAVWTAGRLAGASSVIRRSLFTAGESALRDLETPSAGGVTTDTDATADPPTPGLAPAAPKPVVPRDPVLTLTPGQHAFLAAGATATLAVNDPAGAPFLAASMYRWDGTTVSLPAQDFTARTTHVDHDPRVSLLIEDPASDAWVAVTGVASLVYGDAVEDAMLRILGKYLPEDEAIRRWDEMRSSGDRIVILVRPTRFVWKPA